MKIYGSLTRSQIGLITEAFEQSPETGGEGDMLPCSISLLQPDLTWALWDNELANSSLASCWKQGLERLGGTKSGAAELCLYSHFVNTLAEISGDFFFLYSAEKIVEG